MLDAGEKVKATLAKVTYLQRMYTSCYILISVMNDDVLPEKRFVIVLHDLVRSSVRQDWLSTVGYGTALFIVISWFSDLA